MSTTNIISYNQLMNMFKDFADAHLQINDFGTGPTSEIGTSRQMKFPYMWITHRSPSDFVTSNRTQTPQIGLTFIIVDQINQQQYLGPETNIPVGLDSDNQQEILSDTFQITQDLINYVQTQMGQFGVMLMEGLSTEPVFDETQDKVTGWVTDLKLQLKHSNCVTPLGDIVFTVPGISNISLRYLTCDTLNNCSTFTDAIQDLQDQIDLLENTDLWTIELMDVLTIDFYAPYDMEINSVTDVVNAPVTTVEVNSGAYVLGDPINLGDLITVTVDTNAVVNLNGNKL